MLEILFPKGIAVRSSKQNVALAKEQKTLQRADRESKANQELAGELAKVEISIEVEVGEEDKMFGSVTNLDIHKALTEKDINMTTINLLDQPIKESGFTVCPLNYPMVKNRKSKYT